MPFQKVANDTAFDPRTSTIGKFCAHCLAALGVLTLSTVFDPSRDDSFSDLHGNKWFKNLSSTGDESNFTLTVKRFATIFMSIILTDLGDTTDTRNILLNETAIEEYVGFLEERLVSRYKLNGPVVNLGTSPSVIPRKYLCQVPQRKPIRTMIVSILIADLVFMQALWKLFNLIINLWLTQRDPEGKSRFFFFLLFLLCDLEEQNKLIHIPANYCDGCVIKHQSLDIMNRHHHENEKSEMMSDEADEERGEPYSFSAEIAHGAERPQASYMPLREAEQT